MSYSFKASDTSLTAGLRRIAASQLETALEELADPGLPRAEKIHQVRKRYKKLRGLVRLVRPGFDGYDRENAAFRDAARKLSEVRDATSSMETVAQLKTRFEEHVGPKVFDQVQKRLAARRDRLDDKEIAKHIDEVRKGLTRAARRAESWKVKCKAEDVLADGLAKTYTRAVKALKVARKTHEPDDFHEWRKRVKYHWYHLRLLKDVWPEAMAMRVEAAAQLSDALGDHHDMAVFHTEILPGLKKADRKLVEVLEGLMLAEEERLAEESLAQGEFLFAEAPGKFAARLGAYWKLWRHQEAS